MELTTATHRTATTELVETDGIELAYRRFGRPHEANPLAQEGSS